MKKMMSVLAISAFVVGLALVAGPEAALAAPLDVEPLSIPVPVYN